jgi:DNA-binding response OmpR family regulator
MFEKTKACILVVEDHADTLRFLLRLLQMSGYRAHGAKSFAEAVRVATREQCKLLITDLALPDGSGLDLLPALRRHFDVRGIAVTGHDGRDLTSAAREAGYDAHLVKPVTFDKLLAAIVALECHPSKNGGTDSPGDSIQGIAL